MVSSGYHRQNRLSWSTIQRGQPGCEEIVLFLGGERALAARVSSGHEFACRTGCHDSRSTSDSGSDRRTEATLQHLEEDAPVIMYTQSRRLPRMDRAARRL
jgi:hypothetical protein